jgi:hypothetical protein
VPPTAKRLYNKPWGSGFGVAQLTERMTTSQDLYQAGEGAGRFEKKRA